MVDVALELSDAGADLHLASDDLILDIGLRTAVLISLFSDARADDEEELPGGEGTDPRGWWGDLDRKRPIGSRIWIEDRSKLTNRTLEAIRSAAKGSLAWLVSEGIAEEVTADLSPLREGADLSISITIRRGRSKRFGGLWKGVSDYNLAGEGLRVALLFR